MPHLLRKQTAADNSQPGMHTWCYSWVQSHPRLRCHPINIVASPTCTGPAVMLKLDTSSLSLYGQCNASLTTAALCMW